MHFVCTFQLLQSESDGMEIELRRKEASLDLISTEKNKVLDRLTEEESKWLFLYISTLNFVLYIENFSKTKINLSLYNIHTSYMQLDQEPV